MANFYTNTQSWGGKILYRGLEDGHPVRRRLEYNPTLYVPSKTPTTHTTIYGDYVSDIKPGSIKDCRDFVSKYEDVDGFKIYGNTSYEYSFIADNHPEESIDWDISQINIVPLDIEVGSEDGFPEPDQASQPITAITMRFRDTIHVLGCNPYINSRDNVKYYLCKDEIDLLETFLRIWTYDYPDVITGWNSTLFDIPYLHNRILKLLGEAKAKSLSPWGWVNEKTFERAGQSHYTYNILGIAALDYWDLYRRYAPEGKSQESYRLDAICHAELGTGKLSYEEEGSLHRLYIDNYQKFIDYNIQDVDLIDRLEDKLKLLELALTLAYDSKTNYEDSFSQVRMWHILIYNHLRSKNQVMPMASHHSKSSMYEGAYVKDPLIGLHNEVAGFDLTSLYPSLIMMFNLSPETLIEPDKYTPEMRKASSEASVESFLSQSVDLSFLYDHKVTITPNGQFFTTEKKGFMPEMTEKMFSDRQKYKKLMLAAKKELEVETDPVNRVNIEKRISRYDNLQLSKKVCLNSLYGATGTPYFKFFDLRIAIAITTGGQFAIQWIQNAVNNWMNKLLKTKDKDYVIASDTDSIYLSLGDLVTVAYKKTHPDAPIIDIINFMDKICKTQIQPFINSSYSDLSAYVNAYMNKLDMKREALCDKAIWTAKKRYILNVWNNEGVAYAKPKIKVSGLEVKKSSTPGACREKLNEAIEIIVNKTEDDIIEFIEDFREEFKTLPPGDISFPRGVNGLGKYSDPKAIFASGTPIHVRGSLVYNHFLEKHKITKLYPKIKEGEKIKFIYLKLPNTIQSNVIAFHNSIPKELDLVKYIDYNLQYDKSFVEPLKIILDAIGWKTEYVNTLFGNFK